MSNQLSTGVVVKTDHWKVHFGVIKFELKIQMLMHLVKFITLVI